MNNPPNISQFWREYPHKVLLAFDQEKEHREIIDSELAYTMISAGRKIQQDWEIINQAIADKSFFRNKTLINAFSYARQNHSSVHLIGLLGDSNYSRVNHLIALLELAFRLNFKPVYLDLISNNASSSGAATRDYLEQIQEKIAETGVGQITSITGRSFAMTKNLEKLSLLGKMIISGQAAKADTAQWALNTASQKGQEDFEIEPTLIRTSEGIVFLRENDACIFFNFAPDFMKFFPRILFDPNLRLPGLQKKIIPGLTITTMTKYFKTLNTQVAFPRPQIEGNLAEIFAKYEKSNLRIGEEIKSEHITTFFNGGRKEPFAYEEREIVPSLKVNNFINFPAMSGAKITELAQAAIISKKYDFICLNFPNPDILAHTGNIIATGRAVKAVDNFVGQIVEENLKAQGATLIVADHGIVEEMKGPKTKHSTNPVPFILIAKDKKRDLLKGALTISYSTLSKLIEAKDTLSDVAPTILELLNLPKPAMMTGHSLLNKLD